MKAMLSIEPGGPDTLRLADVEAPRVGSGEVRVRVIACAINYPDVLIIADKYQIKPQRPFAPGAEISGIVEEVGSGVDDLAVGDRVVGMCMYGGMAEQVVVPADRTFRLPPGLDVVAAAGLLLTYGTTIHALVDRGQLVEGETVLILGAAGGIGLSGIEMGKALGARVIAAVSSQAKANVAIAAGADDAILYPRGPLDRDTARALTVKFKEVLGGDGADVIYDPVGGDYAETALRSIAWGGRYLVVGFPAGIPCIPLNLPLLKSCDIRGVFWGAFVERQPLLNRTRIEQLFQWWVEGRINPRVDDIFTLSRAGEAIERLASREAIGKVIVTISPQLAP